MQSRRNGTASGRRLAALYAIGVGLPAAAAATILIAARRGHSPAALPPAPASGFNIDRILAVVVIIVVIAHLAGALAARFGQPRVIGNALAGLALGPTVLGHAAPQFARWLHGGGSDQAIALLSQLGVILFVFLIGRELAASRHAPRATAVVAVGVSMTAVPLLLGVTTAVVAFRADRPSTMGSAPFTLFVGLLMAATALPVLAHLLTERGLLNSPVGALATSAAATGDACVWCLLAVTLCLAQNTSPTTVALHLGLAVAFLALLWWVVRPALLRVLPNTGITGPVVPALLLAGVLISAQLTDVLGLHAIFGAFLFGLIMPTDTPAVRRVTAMTEGVTEWLLLPLFFAAIGTRTNLDLGNPGMLAEALLVVAVAASGKIGIGAGAARTLGMSWRDSAALGVMLNCRGMTELVLLSVGRTAGIIDDRLFAIFVTMALVTTAMTGPLLGVIGIRPPDKPPARTGADEQVTDREFRQPQIDVVLP